MGKISLEPYLFFKGDCMDAMKFYKSVFGGEVDVSTYGDTPGMESFNKDWLMHASLHGGDVELMASDTQKASPLAKKVSLSLGGTDEKHMREIFDKLAKGGKVTQPLEKQFWGDIYGQLTDKYKIDWMMNIGTNMPADK